MKKRNEDRISVLPEELLHHILGFLDMKQVVQTSLLSKRWRCLWRSHPNLNFDHAMWHKSENKDNFTDFVDKVILLHENYNVCNFSLKCRCFCGVDRIGKWINAAVRRNVREFYFDFWSEEYIELPDSLFTSAITSATLNSLEPSAPSIRLPSSMCLATHLKTLKLISVVLPKGDLKGELTFSCPLLEDLIVRNCDHEHLKSLDIFTLRLQSLVLENDRCITKNDKCQIKLCTPYLRSVVLKRDMYEDYFLGVLSCLVTAEIQLIIRGTQDAKGLIKILKVVCAAVRTLRLFYYPLFVGLSTLGRLPSPLDNLRKLMIRIECRVTCFGEIVNLLKISPCIEFLVIGLIETKHESADTVADFDKLLCFQCTLSHLSSIKILYLDDCEYELKFVEFVARSAPNLRNFTCRATNTILDDRDKLAGLQKKLLSVFARRPFTISFEVPRTSLG